MKARTSANRTRLVIQRNARNSKSSRADGIFRRDTQVHHHRQRPAVLVRCLQRMVSTEIHPSSIWCRRQAGKYSGGGAIHPLDEDRGYEGHSGSTADERHAARDRLLCDVVQSVPSESGARRTDPVGGLRRSSAGECEAETRTSGKLADHRVLCLATDGDPRQTGRRTVSRRWVYGRQAPPAGGRAPRSGVILNWYGRGRAPAATYVRLLVLVPGGPRTRQPRRVERDFPASSRLQDGRTEFPGPLQPR
jgi:hypothetical protein